MLNFLDESSLEGLNQSLIEYLRTAEIQVGSLCLRPENLPAVDADSTTLTKWAKEFISASLSLFFNNVKLKNSFFGKKTERMVKEANNVEKKVERIKKKPQITQSQKDSLVNELQQKITNLKLQLHQCLNDDVEHHCTMARLNDAILHLTKQREEIMKLEAIPDPDQPDAPDQPNNPDQPNTSEQPDSQDGCKISPEDRALLDKTAENVQAHEAEQKSQQPEPEEKVDPEKRPVKDSTTQVKPKPQDKERNPRSGELENVHEMPSLTKQAEVLDETFSQMRKSLTQVIELQNKADERYTLHPASCYELEGLDKDGNVTENVNSSLILSPDTDEKEALKASLNTDGFSERLLAIMTVFVGWLVFSPTEFLGVPSRLYGMRPCFVRSRISERLAIKIVMDFVAWNVTKSRFAICMGLRRGESILSKQQIILLINGLSRALSPLAAYMRKILLEHSRSLHTDDCVMTCLEWRKNDNGEAVRRVCYFWGLVTGAHEELQGVMYQASISRNTEEFLRQFGYSSDEDGTEVILKCVLESLVTDCNSVYIPGVEKLKEMTGLEIVRGGCYVHLRRYFRDALKIMDLQEIADAVSTGPLEGYEDRLEAELAARNRQCGTNGRKVLLAYFMITMIFRLEKDFAYTDRATMEKRRAEATEKCVNELYTVINELKDTMKGLKQKGERNGIPQYEGGKDFPWGAAVVYALNNKTEMYAFLHNGDMACSNNMVERMLRDGRSHIRMMEFFATSTGFMGFAVLMTIYETCMMNGVNPYEYCHWAFANAKLRIERYRLATSKEKETSAQICWLPTPNKKGEERVNLYDPEYTCCFDKISWEGLDVWSYAKLLKEEAPRIRPQFLKSKG